MVDVWDVLGSYPQQMIDLLKDKHVVLVATKVDLLPFDSKPHQERLQTWLRLNAENYGRTSQSLD